MIFFTTRRSFLSTAKFPNFRLNASCATNKSVWKPRYRKDPFCTDEALRTLVQQGKYAYAYRVYLQLHYDGIPIRHSSIYLKPALAQLSDISERSADIFYVWISLLPSRHHMPGRRLCPNPFEHEHFDALYTSGYPAEMIPVVYQFARSAASKGFFPTVFNKFMAFIVRFVTPSNGTNLVCGVMERAVQYEIDHGWSVVGRFGQDMVKRRIECLQSKVVRACLTAGWDEAVEKIRSREKPS
ncbi:hypothetical protein E1B28_009966 [Marasmius oreades]|uniref:Uncharacterized protein n=1 Tax=Marasmius oreades TaxID=181124 RepID=A0A9P7US82_9AGAR|nr:uncharacterized protein E1B28_009966 [Marasmius oreades]KAG7090886.1 hypothetical protein E1B28_009966 [Marasmius oreades]